MDTSKMIKAYCLKTKEKNRPKMSASSTMAVYYRFSQIPMDENQAIEFKGN